MCSIELLEAIRFTPVAWPGVFFRHSAPMNPRECARLLLQLSQSSGPADVPYGVALHSDIRKASVHLNIRGARRRWNSRLTNLGVRHWRELGVLGLKLQLCSECRSGRRQKCRVHQDIGKKLHPCHEATPRVRRMTAAV